MKLLEIFRFEFGYQIRNVSPYIYALVLIGIAFLIISGNYIPDAREGYVLLNAPSVIANTTVLCSLVWVLMAAAIAGEAAARDMQIKMDSLIFTSPIKKFEYLGGRFIAAFVLNAIILLSIPAGIWLTIYGTGVEAEILGPSRPAAFLTAYGYIALPNAFFVTAVQFSLAAIKHKSNKAYLGSFIFFILTYVVAVILFGPLKQQELGSLIDPIGVVAVLDAITNTWSPMELNTRLLTLDGSLLVNRLFWSFIGLSTLFLTTRYFNFSIAIISGRKSNVALATIIQPEVKSLDQSPVNAFLPGSKKIAVPLVERNFEIRTHLRQALAICRSSFLSIFRSRGGLIFVVLLGLMNIIFVILKMQHLGVPFVPVTLNVLDFLVSPLSNIQNFALLLIPLLIIYYAGELMWREREAGISEINNAAPIPDWVLFLGKFLGLSLILLIWLLILTLAGILSQLILGFYDIQPELYLQIIFGLRFSEYLLYVLLALIIHAIINHKYLGHLIAILIFGSVAFASVLGIKHNLLIFGADPGWSYTEMRGYAGTLEPWFWFKLYWLGWALLLAVFAILMWVRGRESGARERLKVASRRFTARTALTAGVLMFLIVSLGGYIFYNTNVLNTYQSSAELLQQHAQYEHKYGRYRAIPQPQLTGTNLHVEIYPEKRELEITGTYQLVNLSSEIIDTIHVAPVAKVNTEISFDRSTNEILADKDLGHYIFTLQQPLSPGDTLQLNFHVSTTSPGFSNNGTNLMVVPNGTFFRNYEVLPAVGYQEVRELDRPGDRKTFGLPPRPSIALLEDPDGRKKTFWDQMTTLEATMGTTLKETAYAPGDAGITWTEGDRHYSIFSSTVPLVNQYAFFSGKYAVEEGQWQDPASEKTVDIRVLHHPSHTLNVDRIMKSTIASLDYFSREFGPYPYNSLRFIEHASTDTGLQSKVINISYQERFSYLNSKADPRNVDFVYAIVAHEVAHQWWGNQLLNARVEGSGLLSESLAWYTAMGVAEDEFNFDYQQSLLSILRQEYTNPHSKADVPLIRGTKWFHNYRKGPLALYALSKYIGRDKVNSSLRNLLEKQDSLPGLPTTLDLYRELKAVTPDSLQYLAHDLFEVNTHWDLKTNVVTVTKSEEGQWEVTLEVEARKMIVDSTGVETKLPIDDWIQIGIFAPAKQGEHVRELLYVDMHHFSSTNKTITINVREEPGKAGIDPYFLLNDWKMHDNLKEVKMD